MKATKIISAYAVTFCMTLVSCSSLLEEEMFSQMAPDNFLVTEEGLKSVLFSAYADQSIIGNRGNFILHAEEWCTDTEWETGGGANRTASLFINYTWDPSVDLFMNMWSSQYVAIRNANIVLENVENAEIPDDMKATLTADAMFIRAMCYARLYTWFGPVPLRRGTEDELELARASQEEVEQFVISELVSSIAGLPDPGEEESYGRATKGSARAILCKFYLNTKKWQECVTVADELMDMGDYELHPSFEELFKVRNEKNREFIFVNAAIPNGPGNEHMNGTFPINFAEDPKSGLKFINSWRNWARQDRLLDGFYDSFEPDDKRRDLILTEYIDFNGKMVSLLGNNNTRSFKYWPDPNGLGNSHGNDIPEVRYADILLSKAEALNEVNGPNQVSVDLINEIRERAGLEGLELADFPSQESLRLQILDERAWEFYSERKRREDLKRMGLLIQDANNRGVSVAKPTHALFPIPQAAMDSNPKLVQNDGY
ncbi:RagB/SusD family nutrient uptake outer membrane protein [Echinicola sp. CAU 1574]|uniref:RagB/SusD family nutrient uptake outer membrane protein n=1 Tax=Echinicola arenosa TaxID=2774144 RepID=A0ABR9AQ33_9BACT|nr:RagB/SusD family nutrient uptake outer membrane protein [Echinicola arenosa]MBD8490882.1 RagB/SusD family nutrient uptake outer membrane protein [Echinicola arenosa]